MLVVVDIFSCLAFVRSLKRCDQKVGFEVEVSVLATSPRKVLLYSGRRSMMMVGRDEEA